MIGTSEQLHWDTFPEGFGMHYVSINMNIMVSDQLISTLDRKGDIDDSSNTTAQSTAVSDPKNKSDLVHYVDDSNNTSTEHTALKDLRNNIDNRRA